MAKDTEVYLRDYVFMAAPGGAVAVKVPVADIESKMVAGWSQVETPQPPAQAQKEK